MCKNARAVRDAIIKEKYKLSILDFLRLTNIRGTEDLIYYKKEIVKRLPDDCGKIISSYLRKINMQQIIPKTIYTSVVYCNGKYLTTEDKEKILSYIKDNDLLYIDSVYMAIYREYLNDKLDLDKPFK